MDLKTKKKELIDTPADRLVNNNEEHGELDDAYTDSNDNETKDKIKIKSEIEKLNTDISNLLNEIHNIDYDITTNILPRFNKIDNIIQNIKNTQMHITEIDVSIIKNSNP